MWQPITGKRRGRERAAVAAFREFYEETGLKALRMWALETVTAYFDPGSELLSVLPLFAIEVAARDRVRLSSEHDAARFTTARAAGSLYLWESQRRGLDAVQREVLTRKDLARALELRLEGGRLVL